MASISKVKKGWRAIVHRRRYKIYKSKSFKRKFDAEIWARKIEQEIDAGIYRDRSEAETTTLETLMLRYLIDVSSEKKGINQERYRMKVLLKDPLAGKIISTIQGKDIHNFIARRSRKVSVNTVNRDLNLLGHIFTVAMKDWSIPLIYNPVQMVRRPKSNSRGRDRRLANDEEHLLLSACDSCRDPWLKSAIIMAIETAMRRGELAELRWEHVNAKQHHLLVSDSKNDTPRVIPLSKRATETLLSLPRSLDGRVFQVASANAISMKFKRLCNDIGIEGLRFHDLRHEATSRLFEKNLSIMEVAHITGHKTLGMLKRYTHLQAENLLKKLG